MKYLVIGGAGFIGSNLAEDLVKRGHKVIVVDNLSTGSLDNLSNVKNKIKFIEVPAMKVLELKELKNLDGIFHLGIPSTTTLYRNNRELVGISLQEFVKVLELAKRENCKLIYASSSSIYNGNPLPFSEDMEIKVTDFYTEARYLMERLAKLYYDFYQVKSIGLRLFSVYGPKEKAKKNFANLGSQFLWDIKAGRRPLIYGNGSQTRDFVYVDDVIRGFIAGMNSEIDCDIFNLGSGKCYSLNELVEILNKILGKNIKPVYQKNPIKNYVKETLADTTKVKKVLGWSAKISLEEGIKKLL
ncbi:MAG: GDP-mannose 4,6-dehydratase [Patescibacteria group bacterium]|nr:GDP-mannose 4,6-dehydratase [Patescibacteria group bacterium]